MVFPGCQHSLIYIKNVKTWPKTTFVLVTKDLLLPVVRA